MRGLLNRTGLLILLGLALRLFLIFPGPLESRVEMLANKADLRNYYWPAQTALRGENPYALWASGQSDGFRADLAPLELAVYVVTVSLWNDPRAIQVLFALCDALNIGLLGRLLQHAVIKTPFQFFYALGPLALYNLALVPQDKTILLALTFALFYVLLRESASIQFHLFRFEFSASRATLVILIASSIAAFKWLSIFYVLPLLLFVSNSRRAFAKNGIAFLGVLAMTHLLWFPSWSYVYSFRATRVAAPFHIAPAVLLNALRVYDPIFSIAILLTVLLVIYTMYWRRRIDIFETLMLSTAAGILATPDMDPVHLSVVVFMTLLVMNWAAPTRRIAVWTLSLFVTAVYAITTHDAFGSFSTARLQKLTGAYASPPMILLSYALAIAALAFYFWDKWRGRAVGRAVLEPGVVDA